MTSLQTARTLDSGARARRSAPLNSSLFLRRPVSPSCHGRFSTSCPSSSLSHRISSSYSFTTPFRQPSHLAATLALPELDSVTSTCTSIASSSLQFVSFLQSSFKFSAVSSQQSISNKHESLQISLRGNCPSKMTDCWRRHHRR